ncbi:MAG: hemin receptor [Betaproteobacteria bacterium]|nr:hemin receptor [Betaproteobacteria bacterium]
MTPQHIALVRSSFAEVSPIADSAAKLFYSRLFELDPGLRRLFKSNIEAQGSKLMNMITAAVCLLDQPEKLMPVVRNLGQRHTAYGVEDHHYETVGAALLWTLEKGLGAAFTPEVENAWAAVYGTLAMTMKEAASEMFEVA